MAHDHGGLLRLAWLDRLELHSTPVDNPPDFFGPSWRPVAPGSAA
ncbi:hypothetical protein [Polaromonas sp.]|nr:hypothetical protein [Polaromonas sp.]